jgi:thymidylate synthase ThyX
MAKVTLIDYTGKGVGPWYAASLLVFTKNTRLQMSPEGFGQFINMPLEELEAELAYMANTIPSSWEFADVTFMVEGISRATAQQMTRTRNASFAMQSQRVTDMSEVDFDEGSDIKNAYMKEGIQNYSSLVNDWKMPLEDARDVLPIGVHCNLVAKYNFRAFVELVMKRDSLRVQGPYVDVVMQMKDQVIAAWPWSVAFFVPKQEKAIKLLEEVAKEIAAAEGEKGAMYKGITGKLAKAADLLKA